MKKHILSVHRGSIGSILDELLSKVGSVFNTLVTAETKANDLLVYLSISDIIAIATAGITY